MSTAEHDIEQDTERAERPVLHREFSAELSAGDGRTVDVRIVPYRTPAEVSDDGRTIYREEWDDNCFDEQLVAGHRLKVLLNFEHLSGISNIVGKGISLRSVPGDGLHGSFRMDEGQDGDKALRLVQDGILDGVSLEAFPKKSIRTTDGVVRRVRAHLHNVALCRRPAFSDARVLAVREETHQIIDEALLPVDMDPDLVERCRQAGAILPQRYQAHPDATGTPASTGTPEDGTRQTTGSHPFSEE
jgi:HK97 family phage prohead protease